jgi:hypothetical protein
VKVDTRAPGWDAKAISAIAEEHYGGLQGLFEAEEWPERGAAMLPAVGRRVVETYGTVEAFLARHPIAVPGSPYAQITADPPNVMLTNFYGFTPETWGFLGFTNEAQRTSFLNRTKPGVLVVVYGHKTLAPKEQRGMVIGVQQVSHRVNSAKAFMSPSEWALKADQSESAGKWNYACKATRAWHVPEEAYVPVEEFAPETYSRVRAQAIGSMGMMLTAAEARGLLKLPLVETSVFGEIPIADAVPATGAELFGPSRPGPVSQSSYFCREAEGPKSLYVLRLRGNESAFLGYPAEGRWIVKVGMSGNPAQRCRAFNSALPDGAFYWEIVHTNALSGLPLFPKSKEAINAEVKAHEHLHTHATWLRSEFFLAKPEQVTEAWTKATSVLNS